MTTTTHFEHITPAELCTQFGAPTDFQRGAAGVWVTIHRNTDCHTLCRWDSFLGFFNVEIVDTTTTIDPLLDWSGPSWTDDDPSWTNDDHVEDVVKTFILQELAGRNPTEFVLTRLLITDHTSQAQWDAADEAIDTLLHAIDSDAHTLDTPWLRRVYDALLS